MGSLFHHVTVRWTNADGKRVPPDTPGATKCEGVPDKCWWAKYRDADGRVRTRRLKVKDQTTANRMLADIERNVKCEEVGLPGDYLEQLKRPLSVHLQEWYESLEQLDITSRRKKDVPQRMKKLIRLTGWTRLTDIKVDSVRKALNQLGVSLQTRNHYLQHIKQFIIWCIPERLQNNPITKIKRAKVGPDIRHERRHLSAEEVAKFLTCTERSKVIRGKFDGTSRAMLYAMALGTGLRRGELQSLTFASFDLEKCLVTVDATYSKNRMREPLKIPPWLVERLRVWFSEGRPLWPNLTRHTSKMIRKDLEDAGIPYKVTVDNRDLYADFHALRHTFATMMGQIEPSMLHLMRLTRHKSHALVLRYAKTTSEDMAKSINQLADPFAKSQADNPSDE